jgi:hypothetical protein
MTINAGQGRVKLFRPPNLVDELRSKGTDVSEMVIPGYFIKL